MSDAASKPDATAKVPSALAEVEIGRDIGRGATSVVRLATHQLKVLSGSDQSESTIKNYYAIKVVEKAKIVGEKQLQRLFREKELLGSLKHPSIVGFHATFKDEAHLYFLLELLPGGELLWHMRRERQCRVAPATTKLTLAALLLPLNYMQEQGVLYRDLKPTNIAFAGNGQLKLLDFGHAKRIEGGSAALLLSSDAQGAERSTSVCGTPHYHAPEMVRGEGHGLPAQIWALGVLLVEMLNGRAPFWAQGAGGVALNDQILAANPDLSMLPDDAKSLASALLLASADERSAAFGNKGYAGVMAHAWFEGIDWAAIEAGKLVPSFDFSAHCNELFPDGKDEEKSAEADLDKVNKAFADF